jgi:hypothetical protein
MVPGATALHLLDFSVVPTPSAWATPVLIAKERTIRSEKAVRLAARPASCGWMARTRDYERQRARAQAMHRLQVLTERYIAEGLTPADARTRAREELRANPRRDWRAG